MATYGHRTLKDASATWCSMQLKIIQVVSQLALRVFFLGLVDSSKKKILYKEVNAVDCGNVLILLGEKFLKDFRWKICIKFRFLKLGSVLSRH